MFGPAVPADFEWTTQALASTLSEAKLAELPEGWETLWDRVVELEVTENYGGSLDAFRSADPVEQSKVWYDFFDYIAVEEPPRQTCVLVTLSEPARRNLARVIGRGILGQSPGRLFEIGEECGVTAPPKPTTAPPPFSWFASTPVVDEPVIHIGGPPVDNVAIDEEGTITLVRLIGYSLALGLGLSMVLLRSFRLMLMVFFVGRRQRTVRLEHGLVVQCFGGCSFVDDALAGLRAGHRRCYPYRQLLSRCPDHPGAGRSSRTGHRGMPFCPVPWQLSRQPLACCRSAPAIFYPFASLGYFRPWASWPPWSCSICTYRVH